MFGLFCITVVAKDLNVETELQKRAKRYLEYEAYDEGTIRDLHLPNEELRIYGEPMAIKYDQFQAEKSSKRIAFSKHYQHKEKKVEFLSNDKWQQHKSTNNEELSKDPTPPAKISNKPELNCEDLESLDFEINELETMSLNVNGGSLEDSAVTAHREEVPLEEDYKQDAELSEEDLSHDYIKKETKLTKVTFQNDPEGDMKEQLVTSVWTSQINPDSQLSQKEKIQNNLDMLSNTINEGQATLEESFSTSEQSQQLVEGENVLEEKNLPTDEPAEVNESKTQEEETMNTIDDLEAMVSIGISKDNFIYTSVYLSQTSSQVDTQNINEQPPVEKKNIIIPAENLTDLFESQKELNMLLDLLPNVPQTYLAEDCKQTHVKHSTLEEIQFITTTGQSQQFVSEENISGEIDQSLSEDQPKVIEKDYEIQGEENLQASDNLEETKSMVIPVELLKDLSEELLLTSALSHTMEDVKGITGEFAVDQSHELIELVMETSTTEQTHSSYIEDQDAPVEQVDVSDLIPKTGFIQDLKPIEPTSPTSHLTEVRVTEDSDILGNFGASPEVNIVITRDHGSSEDKSSSEIKSSVEENASCVNDNVHTAADQEGENLETATEKPPGTKSDLLSEAEDGEAKTKETLSDQVEGTLVRD
ncbi:hypothetical protein XELAEV_18002251mg [Xenopus laevis]|nr:hypothetical protein XELAEV_18002251mg [Xenopus laevis]